MCMGVIYEKGGEGSSARYIDRDRWREELYEPTSTGRGGVGRWCERPTGRRLGRSVQVRDRYFKRGGENVRGCARLRDEAEGMDDER
jgi:hypothetical protein